MWLTDSSIMQWVRICLEDPSERCDVRWPVHSMTFSYPAQQPASQTGGQNGFEQTKKTPLWQEKKKGGSLKGTKQTFNSHNKDKVKRTRAVKKSAVEGCHSRQSLWDVQQRKYSVTVLSLRHVQSFRGKNKRTQRLNKLSYSGVCGKHNSR